VLEDLHFMGDPTCLDAVAALLEHVPDGSRMVLATREEPELPLPRLRALGGALEVGQDDLRLNEQEAATLLRNAGVDLDRTDVSELTSRTEGWPAGLTSLRCRCGLARRARKGREAYAVTTAWWPTTFDWSSCRG
jgi:LuxR family maltose regulon positive regulatory protein